MSPSPIRILVAACGHMGKSHAKAYQKLDGFEIVGVVSRGPASREALLAEIGAPDVPQFSDDDEAFKSGKTVEL